jgi:hypothetical protein
MPVIAKIHGHTYARRIILAHDEQMPEEYENLVPAALRITEKGELEMFFLVSTHNRIK